MALTPKKIKKLKKLKNPFLDTNLINIDAKLQVSRFNGVARMEVRNTHTNKYIYKQIKEHLRISLKHMDYVLWEISRAAIDISLNEWCWASAVEGMGGRTNLSESLNAVSYLSKKVFCSLSYIQICL